MFLPGLGLVASLPLVSYCFLVYVTVVSMVSGGVWFTSRFGFARVGDLFCTRSWLAWSVKKCLPSGQATRQNRCHVHEAYEFEAYPEKFSI